jgi:hypothetical protein
MPNFIQIFTLVMSLLSEFQAAQAAISAGQPFAVPAILTFLGGKRYSITISATPVA